MDALLVREKSNKQKSGIMKHWIGMRHLRTARKNRKESFTQGQSKRS